MSCTLGGLLLQFVRIGIQIFIHDYTNEDTRSDLHTADVQVFQKWSHAGLNRGPYGY